MPRRPCAGGCGKNRDERFFLGPRGRICDRCRSGRTRRANHDRHLRETYGITAAEYAAILLEQGGKCAICLGVRKDNLDVDHDHKLKGRASIRGLLCRRCNRRLLPSCKDQTEILMRAIAYLEFPPARKVVKP